MPRPHLRDLAVSDLSEALQACGAPWGAVAVRNLLLAIHRRGASTWDALPVGRARRHGRPGDPMGLLRPSSYSAVS